MVINDHNQINVYVKQD